MALTLTGITGEGSSLINGGGFVVVTDIEWDVTTYPGKYRQYGDIEPIGVRQLGELFIGYSGPPADWVWGFFIHHSSGDQYVPQFQVGSVYADNFWWRLVMGVTLDVIVNF